MLKSKGSKCPACAIAMLPAICVTAAVHKPARRSPADAAVSGYIIVPHQGRVDAGYNAGYSMYVAAWPLLDPYPGHRFQSGLPGTWMFAQHDGAPPPDAYSDVEGGLGWWTDTRFPTTTPKFIMGGVGLNFSYIANGPGHGAGSWQEPRGQYGVAQLSPWLLFPLDGLNVRQGERGGMFGYGYLNLPLLAASPGATTAAPASGTNCWTLFLSTSNFKGPVAFFVPSFWARSSAAQPRLAGQLLDTRPADPNRAVQMETQYTPCQVATDERGQVYARIAPIAFPRTDAQQSLLLEDDTAYDHSALFDQVAAWFAGGHAPTGRIARAGAFARLFMPSGYTTWQIGWTDAAGAQRKAPIQWSSIGAMSSIGPTGFGCRWSSASGPSPGGLVTLPEYYRLSTTARGAPQWLPTGASDVPAETHLADVRWERPAEPRPVAYATPDDRASCWRSPGPAAGPYRARLGDGTVVTYYWYRFEDQPALVMSGLTRAQRHLLQSRVEKLHRAWPRTREYLAPPTTGVLAGLDPAQIVRPPKGLEVGYVPIATRQELARP